MPAIATIGSGTITDSLSGTVRRDLASATTGSDGLGGPVVASNPDFAAGSTTGWAASAGCTLTAPADSRFGPNYPFCGRMVLAAGGGGRSILTQLINVQTDLPLAGVLLAYVEGGGTATLAVRLEDPSLVGVIATATTVTLTGDVQAIPYTFSTANLAGYVNPYLEIAGTASAAQMIHVTHIAPQPPGDSSLGIYEASVPILADCFPADVKGWSGFSGGTVTWDATRGKWGTHSIVLDLPAAAAGGANSSVKAAAAATQYTFSALVVRSETAANVTVDAHRQDFSVAFGTKSLAATLAPQLVTSTFTTDGSTTGLALIFFASLHVSVRVLAGWIDPGPVALPFPGDDGTRAAARVQLPANLLSGRQCWFAKAFRTAWPSSAPPSASPTFLLWGAGSDYLLLYFTGGVFVFQAHVAGVDYIADSPGVTFAAGDLIVLGCTVGSGGLVVFCSVAGAAVVSGTTGSYVAPAVLGTLFDVGSNVGTFQQDARDYWVAGGTGTLVSADYTTIKGWGATDPTLAQARALNGGASGATFVYPANDTAVAAFSMAATGTWALAEAYTATFAAGPTGDTRAPSSYGPVPGTPQQQLSFQPGSAHRLSLTGAKDANGLTLDAFTVAAVAQIDALDGTAPLMSSIVPAVSAGAWALTIPGDAFAAGAAQSLTARLSDLAGAAQRLTASFGLTPAEPVKLNYQPLQEWPLVVSGLTLPSGWTGTITVVDRAGHGTTQVAAAALVPVGTAGAQFDIDSSVMVAGGSLLVTVQFLSSGGAKLLCRRYLLTSGW